MYVNSFSLESNNKEAQSFEPMVYLSSKEGESIVRGKNGQTWPGE